MDNNNITKRLSVPITVGESLEEYSLSINLNGFQQGKLNAIDPNLNLNYADLSFTTLHESEILDSQ
eukprot:Pgem_evm1s2825